MTHLYIDTNAYLTFYHLSSDDLEELKKVLVLIERTNEITLHLPAQTIDEYERNREVKIADALKRFREEKLNKEFPQICKEYPEYSKMREAIKEYDQQKAKLLEKLTSDITNHKLEADRIIKSLFEKAIKYPSTDELINRARIRYDLGRPPGKNKSYGDALNWEALLNGVNNEIDLHFVSEDKDYYSDLNNLIFNHYLAKEWSVKKSSRIFSYKRMSEFFKANFPHIKLAADYEKDNLIKDLAVSGSFKRARTLLWKLSDYEEFSEKQLTDFVLACNSNSQIRWIRDDKDIQEIITEIIKPNRTKIAEEILTKFDEDYGYTK
jgi:hypothetical protein